MTVDPGVIVNLYQRVCPEYESASDDVPRLLMSAAFGQALPLPIGTHFENSEVAPDDVVAVPVTNCPTGRPLIEIAKFARPVASPVTVAVPIRVEPSP